MTDKINSALAALKMFEQQYRGLLELAPILKDVAGIQKLRKEAEANTGQVQASLTSLNAAYAARREEMQTSAAELEASKKQAKEIVAAAQAKADQLATRADNALKDARVEAEAIKAEAAADIETDRAAASVAFKVKATEAQDYLNHLNKLIETAKANLAVVNAAVVAAAKKQADAEAEVARLKNLFK